MPSESRADKIKRWAEQCVRIRDAATTPAAKTYAEQYLEYLRAEYRKEMQKVNR